MSQRFSSTTTANRQRRPTTTFSNTQPAFMYDLDDEDFNSSGIENNPIVRDVSFHIQQERPSSIHRSEHIPKFSGPYHTPQLKRKRVDEQIATSDSTFINEQLAKLNDCLKSIDQKLDEIKQKENIFEKQLEMMNKRFGRLISNKTDQYATRTIPGELPPVVYNGRNLLLGPLGDSPGCLMKRLINELFTKEEIIAGEHENVNERTLQIQEAVKVSFLNNDNELLEAFWNYQGKLIRGNQRRGRLFRNKNNDSTTET